MWVEFYPLEIFPLSRSSALRTSHHPTASVSSSIPPSISGATVGKKPSLPASPDLNLTPHHLILRPSAISHRSQLSRLDGSALEGIHGHQNSSPWWTSTRGSHRWPGAGSATHPPVCSECIHGHHSMAQGTHKMGTALSCAQPSTALRFSGGLLAWSSLVTSDRTQGAAGDVSGKGWGDIRKRFPTRGWLGTE